ncbi:response regulator transcription factor [Rossellomorea sp. AcN35-11]|nr:response regulator transcription factor [Rossellomorea aquimaris]NMH67919.1 response regulator transcription factor [Bacillus sp. RO3]WJV31392.1 response regulator transcription factor [Rossellomorea sp. AcN35-11]
MNKTILVVEDEDRMREIISDYLKSNHFSVIEASDGQQALTIFEQENVDLIVLDIMMPNMDGWSVCKKIRKDSDVPIIILTARSDEEDELMGLELGADEYVTKPISPKVLVARAVNLLKRANGTLGKASSTVKIGRMEILKNARIVKIDDEKLAFSQKEYDLLLYLIENKGTVLSREMILNRIWGFDYFGDERVVDTHIKKIRRKLKAQATKIQTVIGVGYRFEVDE